MLVPRQRFLVSLALVFTLAFSLNSGLVFTQQRGGPLTAEQEAKRWETEKELASVAVIDRKVMMPMRDGVRLATDIYRPKNA